MRYRFINRQKKAFSVVKLCKWLCCINTAERLAYQWDFVAQFIQMEPKGVTAYLFRPVLCYRACFGHT